VDGVREQRQRVERDAADDPRGLGLSDLAYSFLGGLKANAKAYIAVTAPTVASGGASDQTATLDFAGPDTADAPNLAPRIMPSIT